MIDPADNSTMPPQPATKVNSQSYAEQIRQRRMARRSSDPVKTTAPIAPSKVKPTIPQPQSEPRPQESQPAPQQQPPQVSPQQPPQPQQQTYTENINIPDGGGLEQSVIAPGMYKPLQEEIVIQWQAPSRPYKKKDRQFYSTVGIIALLVSLILFFAGQFLPIAVVISIAFLVYVLSVVPPGMVANSFTTYGIRIDSSLYYWEEMGRFWFTSKYGQGILNIEVARFPGRLTILLGDSPRETVEMVLSDVLVQERPKLTFMEKSADWLQRKIPLDTN